MMTFRFLWRSNTERYIDSTRDRSNRNNHEAAEAAIRRCSSKYSFSKFSQYSRKNTFVGFSFTKVAVVRPATFLKTDFPSEYCVILKDSLFNRTSLRAVSEKDMMSPAADDNKLITKNNLRYE